MGVVEGIGGEGMSDNLLLSDTKGAVEGIGDTIGEF